MNHEHAAPLPGPTPGPLPSSLGLGLPTRMRGPGDMAEMLPYLLGFFPDDSIVVVGLHGPRLEQGGVIRLDIPESPDTWPSIAADTARLLIELSEQRGSRPSQVLVYLCHDPADGDRPGVVARLAPLADALVDRFGDHDIRVRESLAIVEGRWWSFLCRGTGCCGPDGTPIRSSRAPSPVAAAATFAGLASRGSRKEITAALAPVRGTEAERLEVELHRAGPALICLLGSAAERGELLDRVSLLIDRAMTAFRAGAAELDAEHTAQLLTGLQIRECRDRGAEYLEPHELATAQRLWRYLARRAVPPFESFGAAPLTLLAWTSWLAEDVATARIVLSRALDLDEEYTLAKLLYESLNAGLRPDDLLDGIRQERAARRSPAARAAEQPEPPSPGPGPGPSDPPAAPGRSRTRRRPPGPRSQADPEGREPLDAAKNPDAVKTPDGAEAADGPEAADGQEPPGAAKASEPPVVPESPEPPPSSPVKGCGIPAAVAEESYGPPHTAAGAPAQPHTAAGALAQPRTAGSPLPQPRTAGGRSPRPGTRRPQ
ncbi:hypothetical protein CFP65_5252 [Kitasatospora sp. MMS16-BH015]|uniref:DUF4192 domain-containing protein n=1 Tax=Kitasatospora sp. MMS16-BH015 TaxID=2018025 RepID=UPI000CA2B48D|nr:DUF4192 domain-containing protein [Kitasatospora sp. MMS16-BH015]AUG79961.1 hypothetical protein CFP65_5252 [Kitasatospora sp. MMS16-BH015]